MKRTLKITLTLLGILAAVILLLTLLPAKIDCGTSEIYTLEDRRSSADLVVRKINTFEGCKLFSVLYEGDAASQKNLDYCNDLAPEGTIYTDCIVFTSYFRSPILGGGAWNANQIYIWSWYLARPADGSWEIVTYGAA